MLDLLVNNSIPDRNLEKMFDKLLEEYEEYDKAEGLDKIIEASDIVGSIAYILKKLSVQTNIHYNNLAYISIRKQKYRSINGKNINKEKELIKKLINDLGLSNV